MSVRDDGGPALVLEVGPGYTWFGVGGVRIDLGQRDALRRLFAALVDAHVQQRGPLPPPELAAAAWPGQAMTRWIASNRLRQSLHTLRKLGLRLLLLARAGGYQLDPRLVVKLDRLDVGDVITCWRRRPGLR